MDNVIEPQTGVINATEVVPQEAEPVIEPQYYVLENDTYVPQNPDLLYPPGTTCYVQHPDGSYSAIGVTAGGVTPAEEMPAMPTITLDQMIATGKSFLEKNGYVVTAASEYESTAELKNQITALKDQLAAAGKPVKAGDRSFELGVLFGKIRSMINSHMPSHALTSEAHETVNKIEELV